MDINRIKDRVGNIACVAARDPETAHSNEDLLYLDFVRHVAANGRGRLKEMANEILKTRDLDFPRWCA